MRLPCALVVLALCVLTAAAQSTTPDANEAYRRAIELEARGDHAAALALLWEAAGLAPRDPDIQNRLGEALERVGALDPAVEAYRTAVAARPGFRKATNNLILALVKAGRSREAIELARASAAQAPDDADRWFTLGLAQSDPDVEEAIASFRRALKLQPGHTLARYNLALVLKRADRLDEAVEELRRVLEVEARAEASYTLGVIHWHRGEIDRAEAALRAAAAADPAYADAHYTLGAVLHARRNFNAASESLRRALALRPDLAGAHYTLGRVLQAMGDDAGARRHLTEAERLRTRGEQEHEARVWTAVGTEKLDDGDALAALDAFRRALAISDRYAPAHYQMGRALQILGDPEAARAAFARAHQLNPALRPPAAR